MSGSEPLIVEIPPAVAKKIREKAEKLKIKPEDLIIQAIVKVLREGEA